MHIPDGFIPISQCIVYYVILIVALYFSVKWARSNLDEKRIPLLAVLAAGIFAIMSMNMPIPFGTSGHMVGGALVAIVFLAGNHWRFCWIIHLQRIKRNYRKIPCSRCWSMACNSNCSFSMCY